MSIENEDELEDKALYKFNKETNKLEKIEFSNVKKVPVVNEEIISKINVFRNLINSNLPHRPELSVIATLLIEVGLESSDVDSFCEKVKSFYRNNYA